ncbi:MAG: hypothetical protein JWP89_5044 [Schlesneria sp.]|nr:hypothetical protein [Schlesneria sp.]
MKVKLTQILVVTVIVVTVAILFCVSLYTYCAQENGNPGIYAEPAAPEVE